MSLLLPFVARSEDRVRRFSKEMEEATVFCLTEIGRDKGGLIRKRPAEEIVFIAEACYPVWRVPWGKTTLLFDGLGLRKHAVSFNILPDTNVFTKEIRAHCNETEAYLDFLTHNLNYFQDFAGEGKKVINGLIADRSFLKEFETYLSKARLVKGTISDKIILAPFMDGAAVKSSADGLSELRSDLETDLKTLNNVVKMLARLTDGHIKLLMRQNEEIRQKAEKEIARFRAESFKKTERLRRRYDKKILKISRIAERTLEKPKKEHAELSERKAHLTAYAEKCTAEISSCEARKEDAGLDLWRKELQKCREEISEIDRKISEIEKNIRSIEQSRDVEVSQLEAEFSAQTEALAAGSKRTEEARDAKIALNEERMENLKEATSTFITQINRLCDLRKSAIADLEKMGLLQVRRKNVLVHVPFFLACLKSGFKSKYVLFPPSIAHGMRGVTKIRGVLKGSKVTVVLDDRSVSIRKFLAPFLQLVKKNPIFEEKVIKAGTKINILGSRERQGNVATGLKRLREEGWLSESEFESFKGQLTRK